MVSGDLVQFSIPWRSNTDTTSNKKYEINKCKDITSRSVLGCGARSAPVLEDVLSPARAVQL